jgi:hypothetical protein
MVIIISGISEKYEFEILSLRGTPNSYFIDFISIGRFRRLVFLYLIASGSSENLYILVILLREVPRDYIHE